eukprot:TRINITY_DN14827_c0_g1_i1.p1 TRINITY_DN14827_c0_g1~~TRINITY_DN14827_c0_g1_i1.p1  ORF type:complete len:561 (+),score=99.01 TRINITY_DN14827_c0_g1_i1:170-1852(+)
MESQTRLSSVALFLSLGILAIHTPSSAAQVVIRLGFLTPYPQTDASIPVRLADEWISAVRIALLELEKDYASQFMIQTYVQNSNCDSTSAQVAAANLVKSGVVGVVGPACSEAALGAAAVLGVHGIPMISFAATAAELNDRVLYPTFFRTSLPDTYQAQAAVDVVSFFNWTRVFMLYSDDSYGRGLSTSILEAATQANAKRSSPLHFPSFPVPMQMPTGGYSYLFKSLKPSQRVPVLLAVPPAMAQSLWKDALKRGALKYPWWYFGMDGVTAFDLIGEGESSLDLAFSLQGELGLYPDRGSVDYEGCSRFLGFWKKQMYSVYPGLLTFPHVPRFTEPRSYVPHLIDAVHAFHIVFAKLIAAGESVTAANVRQGLESSDFSFAGCSGQVKFKEGTGERDTSVLPVTFPLVSLTGTVWKSVGVDNPGQKVPTTLSVSQVPRPGTTSATTATSNSTVAVIGNGTEAQSETSLSSGVASQTTAPGTGDFSGNTPIDEATPPPASSTGAGTSSSSSPPSSSALHTAWEVTSLLVPLLLIVALLGIGTYFYVTRNKKSSNGFVREL